MAYTLNPESDISAFVNPIFQGAILIARDNNVMAPLVRNFNDRSGLAVRQNSQYGGMTINQVAETDDLVGQAFTPASIATLTPIEVAGQYFLTDSRLESDPFAVRNDASTDMGMALSTKIETNLLGLATSLTGGTVGASGTAITWGHVFAASAILRNQKAPAPYVMVLHPYQWQVLAKAASVAGSRTNAPESLLNLVNADFNMGQYSGITVFVSSNVDNSTAAATSGMMFSRDAIALDMRRAPRLEADRKASRRGWELNISSVFAYGVWRPKFGVCMTFDATTPTS